MFDFTANSFLFIAADLSDRQFILLFPCIIEPPLGIFIYTILSYNVLNIL